MREVQITWHDEAIALAAQCWCTPETEMIEMDVRLATVFARALEGWMDTAATNQRNADFYRGLLDQCAAHLGPEVYVSDDRSVQDAPLRLKVPELVASLVRELERRKG